MNPSLRKRSALALEDQTLQRNMARTLPQVLQSHDKSVAQVENWEELREYARKVKAHTMENLPRYLQQLEERVIENGGKVYWAESGEEAVQFILQLAHARDIRKIVKSKSMLGEEIHLNQALESAGIEPVETDLGEYIVQLAGDTPSHIVAPALHLSKEQVARLFEEKLQMPPSDDVAEITALARSVLRSQFLQARLGLTGVNFGVAETGTIVVVENEGNARLSMASPEIHVAIMGIEKVLPRWIDLPVFLKLLTRSATGQKMSSYVNFIDGPKRPDELDGPSEFYLVLIDNGRTRILGDQTLRQSLHCIRCGACLTVCPVYQNIGGHAYGSVYPGPIGSLLTLPFQGQKRGGELPFASSLCGACAETCPVKIEIPHLLLHLRHRVQQENAAVASSLSLERLLFYLWALLMTSPKLYEKTSRWGRPFFRRFERFLQRLPLLSRWTLKRSLPAPAPRTFHALYHDSQEKAS